VFGGARINVFTPGSRIVDSLIISVLAAPFLLRQKVAGMCAGARRRAQPLVFVLVLDNLVRSIYLVSPPSTSIPAECRRKAVHHGGATKVCLARTWGANPSILDDDNSVRGQNESSIYPFPYSAVK
jgi:hypothetical protein